MSTVTRKPSKCIHCGELINYKNKPEMPKRAISGFWEGWFHLDPSKEHFPKVGWYRIKYR